MLETLVKIYEEVVNNFYKQGVSVTLSDTPETAYCQGDHITLPRHLLEEFTAQKLPRFTVMYHELGHALYSHDLNTFIDKWKNLPTQHNSYVYTPQYDHLLNWIEDFYIEDRLVKDYPYLNDIIGCLKRLTLPYDITEIDKAFNHYYVKGYATPTLNPNDAISFKNYLTTLLTLRSTPNFGKGPISLLSSRSKETQFIKTLIEFYNWCVSKTIFDANQVLPSLSNPINTVGNTSSQTNSATHDATQGDDNGAKDGSYSDHSHIVGVQEVIPKFDPKETTIFAEKFATENVLIKNKILEMSKVESVNDSLDGLFNSLFKNTSIIQSKIIVPNFFNPNRLIDQVLFKMPSKSYNNVSIYRDISGSTYGKEFKLINSICKFLDKKIPIDYNFYLYSSGDISILQTSFEDWEDCNDTPDLYYVDPVFQQFTGGTNSSAIADVITEQLNDKWLNIIITDGDLTDLMRRENIQSLLENVFVISLIELDNVPNYIVIRDEDDIEKIPEALLKGAYHDLCFS